MALTISFKDKSVLIVGASRGLGRELVGSLHKQGAKIYALAKSPQNLQKLSNDYPGIFTICVDITNWDETREAVRKIGPVDCLINNAAIGSACSFLELNQKDLQEIIRVNLKGVLNISQVVAEGMIQRGTGGSIINVSSSASKVSYRLASAYCATKAGLDMMTKCMARELGQYKIRVNSVNPTIFYSDMTKELLTQFPNGTPQFLSRCPLGRVAVTSEIVDTILFILSDSTQMINGTTILIDGGHSTS